MKNSIRTAITVIGIFLTVMLHAQESHSALPVYQYTGKVIMHVGMFNSNVDVHTSAGDAYCNVGDSSVTCTDKPAYAVGIVELYEHEVLQSQIMHMLRPEPRFTSVNSKFGHDGIEPAVCSDEKVVSYPFACDPIGILRLGLGGDGTSAQFQYRLIVVSVPDFSFQKHHNKSYYCVPFTVKSKRGEACYELNAAQ